MLSPFDLDMADDDEVLQSKLMINTSDLLRRCWSLFPSVLVNHANSIHVVS